MRDAHSKKYAVLTQKVKHLVAQSWKLQVYLIAFATKLTRWSGNSNDKFPAKQLDIARKPYTGNIFEMKFTLEEKHIARSNCQYSSCVAIIQVEGELQQPPKIKRMSTSPVTTVTVN